MCLTPGHPPPTLALQVGPSGMRIADVLDAINAQASVRVTERDLRLALNELVRGGRCGVGRTLVAWPGLGGGGCAGVFAEPLDLVQLGLVGWFCMMPLTPLTDLPTPLQEDIARVQQGVVTLVA